MNSGNREKVNSGGERQRGRYSDKVNVLFVNVVALIEIFNGIV